MARANHQALRFGWSAEIKRLSAKGDTAGVANLVDLIRGHVDQIGVFDQHWNGVLVGAARRAIPVEISKAHALTLFRSQGGLCAISGVPIAFASHTRGAPRRQSATASLDRIRSEVGYVPGNVWWVHRDVNRMKQDLPLDRFVDLCRRVSEHAGKSDPPTPAFDTATALAGPDASETVRVVARFLTERCVQDAAGVERASTLWQSFNDWRSDLAVPVCSQTAFGRALTVLGFASARGHFAQWRGLRIVSSEGFEGAIDPRETLAAPKNQSIQ